MLFDNTQLALQRALEGASTRQSVLAGNLANANTPGFQRADVDFHKVLSEALSTPSDVHEALEEASFSPERDAVAAAASATGLGIDADAESAKLAENALEQQALVQVAAARISIIQQAIGGR